MIIEHNSLESGSGLLSIHRDSGGERKCSGSPEVGVSAIRWNGFGTYVSSPLLYIGLSNTLKAQFNSEQVWINVC